jgi:putative spermidine/putrescine transport system ATP-binding protein
MESTGAVQPRDARDAASAADVRLVGVRKTYGDVVAVDGIEIEVREGEFFTMLGPSGSGKTTCLRMIAGFERPDAGRIELAGHDVTGLPPNERDVNTVFQDYALFPHMSVGQNVEYGLKVKKVDREERRRRVAEALGLVRLGDFEKRRPSQLSGGQRQRVALARALVNRPRVLLLDEPLGALDLKLRQQLQVELKRIQQEVGITFIYVTHDQDEALTMSDRIAVMDQGQVLQVGAPNEIYDEPESRFVAGFVGVSNVLELKVRSVAAGVAELTLGEADRITAAARDDLRAGDTVTVTIRPERIAIVESGDAGGADDCRAAGTVRESMYAGPTSRFAVALDGGGELIVVRQNARTSFDDTESLRGRHVTLSWPPEHTRVIGTTDERRSDGSQGNET